MSKSMCAGLAVGWMVLAGCGPYAISGEGRGADRVLIEARDKVTRKAAPTHGDEAARRFLEERLPEGAHDIPWERYDVARERMRRMERYATGEPAAAALSWTELGPGNIGGRTRALVIDPIHTGTMYAAGVSGGVWKSVDAGGHWRWISDEFSHLSVSSLALDPTNPKVLYAGTGEVFVLGPRGNGIYRTVDGGATWQHLAATGNNVDFYYVSDIVVSRGDPRRLYAATETGVWRSLDRGATWTRVLEAATGCVDLVIRNTRTTDVVLAACRGVDRRENAVWRNARANAPQGSWVKVLAEPAMGRTALAIAPSKQDVIYAVSTSNSNDPAVPNGPGNQYRNSLHAVFRSVDGGVTWEARVRNTDPVRLNTLLLSYVLLANASRCGLQPAEFDHVFGQGGYDLTIAVDPVNPNSVWVGAIDLFRSDDGGRNWGLASYWWAFGADTAPSYAHADQHVIAFHPKYNGKKNRVLYVGNDGGVFQTRNALAATEKGEAAGCEPSRVKVPWNGLNHDYGSVQFYYGVPRADGESYLGGTQDNGVVLGSDGGGRNTWQMLISGDGDMVAADPEDPDILYARVNGSASVLKSVDGGATFTVATAGLTDSLGLVGQFLIEPSKAKRLWFAGVNGVWRSEDGATTWTPVSKPHGEISSSSSALAVSQVDPNRVLVGTSNGYIHRSTAALSATGETEWPRSRPRTGSVSWIAFDPVDPDVAYATYSNFSLFEDGHVWKTTDGGVTWNQIDGTGEGALPDLPVHTIAVDPTQTDRLYVGTDLGIFVSLDGGGSWAVEEGFSPVITEALQLARLPNGETWLFAFTYGRGVWKVRL
ncbi:MAG TPA: hypothetical protein VF179_01260 [Thermoanaerobaculia bacterium]|nr:hypothetical protein [Thermoanaerobaculia bacterium]